MRNDLPASCAWCGSRGARRRAGEPASATARSRRRQIAAAIDAGRERDAEQYRRAAVEVVAAVDLLDHASGNFERCPVAYLKTTPAALATVNLARAEAFPLFERLGGTIDWQRRVGLRAISTDDFDLPDEPDD